VSVCPKGIVALDGAALNTRGYHPAAVADMDKCIACAFCAVICPDAVIEVER
jgi:2-oxoglutarate ferredoxin oxidoreductase subunit delta